MAALAKLAKYSVKLVEKQPCVIFTAVRCGSHQMNHFKPGPLPKTPEERRKAAAKYGLPESMYDTYPDDGMGYGDYPKMPMISGEARDDYYPWDYPAHKRNYNEPIHVYETLIDETRYNVNHVHRYPMWMMVSMFLGAIFGYVGLFYIFEQPTWKMYPPVMKKQYPAPNKVNYDFPECKADAKVGHH